MNDDWAHFGRISTFVGFAVTTRQFYQYNIWDEEAVVEGCVWELCSQHIAAILLRIEEENGVDLSEVYQRLRVLVRRLPTVMQRETELYKPLALIASNLRINDFEKRRVAYNIMQKLIPDEDVIFVELENSCRRAGL